MRSSRRSLNRRHVDGGEDEPLAELRRRCTAGAFAGCGAYLAVITTTVVRPTALTLKQIIGLEFGLGIMAMACSVVSIVAWILTQNTEYALRIWATAVRSQSLGALPPPADPAVPEPRGGDPIPIGYGHEVRAQRNRQAV